MPETQTPEPIVRAYLARVEDVNPKKRTVVGKINTAALDHYGTVIVPRGIELEGYRKNPVVLWSHGMDPARGELPVGRANWVRPAIGPDGPELIAETEFRSDDEFSGTLFEMYREGLLRAFSVRVVPKAGGYGPPKPEEIRERPELADCWMMYRSTRLAEYSCVAVPGNPECLAAEHARSVVALIARGLTLPTDLAARAQAMVDAEQGEPPARAEPPPARTLPPLGGRSLAELQAARTAELLRLLNPKAIADELAMQADFARGKVYGLDDQHAVLEFDRQPDLPLQRHQLFDRPDAERRVPLDARHDRPGDRPPIDLQPQPPEQLDPLRRPRVIRQELHVGGTDRQRPILRGERVVGDAIPDIKRPGRDPPRRIRHPPPPPEPSNPPHFPSPSDVSDPRHRRASLEADGGPSGRRSTPRSHQPISR